ncbi:hypothetical protein [Flavobacterium silvaticum]|uniref:Uncharacterized protein n=1 Tax=Flavobacterium silvaticum TaxID=1852020 RepID=A0A972JH31_9FLAO|nr:hypothetical protein [Flavobacterium silvaticum]NMH28811.1 hypothetical protein [Flavobacterium silvaticum]
MKNLVLLIFLFPVIAFAQYNPGTVTLNDGSVKSGFIEIPEFQDSKLKFRSTEKASVEKLKVETVKEFEITNREGQTEKFITLKTARNRNLRDGFKINEEKSFLKIVKKNRIAIYIAHFKGTTTMGRASGGISSQQFGGDKYFLQREGDDFAFSIGDHRYDLDFMTGMSTYAVIHENYKEICPEFIEKLKQADLPVSRFGEFVDIYDTACPQK